MRQLDANCKSYSPKMASPSDLCKQSPEVEAAAGLDIERHQLLPNDLGGEQGKVTGVGNQE